MEDLKKKFEIDETNLDEELAKQASMFVYYAELAVKTEKEYQQFKMEAEEIGALIAKQIREEYENEGKKLTEKLLEQEVITNPKNKIVRQKLLDLQAKRDLAKVLKEGWHMRKDMLIQIAINKRAEMESLMSATIK